MVRLIYRIIEFWVYIFVRPMVKECANNITNAPICHNEPMEYIGESLGFIRTRTYQCEICKRIKFVY